MKVKGIESAPTSVPGSWLMMPGSLAEMASAHAQKTRNQQHRIASFLVISLLITLALASTGLADVNDQQATSTREQTLRNARKALRKGEFERAATYYSDLVNRNAQDIQALLGAAFAYMKLQSYGLCFDRATAALKLDLNNARAHALAGSALLHSGLLHAAVPEVAEALRLDSKEPLAYGTAAELDYFEGRVNEARAKALYA